MTATKPLNFVKKFTWFGIISNRLAYSHLLRVNDKYKLFLLIRRLPSIKQAKSSWFNCQFTITRLSPFFNIGCSGRTFSRYTLYWFKNISSCCWYIVRAWFHQILFSTLYVLLRNLMSYLSISVNYILSPLEKVSNCFAAQVLSFIKLS